MAQSYKHKKTNHHKHLSLKRLPSLAGAAYCLQLTAVSVCFVLMVCGTLNYPVEIRPQHVLSPNILINLKKEGTLVMCLNEYFFCAVCQSLCLPAEPALLNVYLDSWALI